MKKQNEHLKIAVVGSGAIGCYYGGLLAESGCDVLFLMRSDLETVRRDGLKIRTDGREIHLEKVQAYATTEEIGVCDLVLISLKTTANDALETLIPPLLKADTALLTLQNGLGNEEFLAADFGAERVMGALCFICLNRVAPGVIEHFDRGTISLGEFGRPPQPRTEQIAEMLRSAGITVSVAENLLDERWRKLVWNVPFNGLSIAAGSITVDKILANRDLLGLTRGLMAEVIATAGKIGCEIPQDYIDLQIKRTRTMGAYQPSSLIDFVANREVEVESIWGEPLRQAQKAGADVPLLAMLYALLKSLTENR